MAALFWREYAIMRSNHHSSSGVAMRRLKPVFLLAALLSGVSFADEGMWTFDNFPLARVNAQYGLKLDQVWLDQVRLASVRLQNCSASFVSPDGLILTNHHCAESCLAENSSKEASLIDSGFIAPDRSRELRCRVQIADILVAMDNVTAKSARRPPASAPRMLTRPASAS
jgi:hypothetical protein